MNITYAEDVAKKLDRKGLIERARGIGRTRAERGLPPYESPKKAWDTPLGDLITEHTPLSRQQTRAAARWEAKPVIQQPEPSSRKQRRIQATNRRVDARKNRRRATQKWFADRHQFQNTLGVARAYYDEEAHKRSPQVCRNATQRVFREAQNVSQRDGIPYTTALKQVEGQLLQLLVDAGER